MSEANQEQQKQLYLTQPPRQTTVNLLFQIFGDVLIPFEKLRERYYRNLCKETFEAAIGKERIPLPTTTVDGSQKGQKYVEIHHLAAYIEARAQHADQTLLDKLTLQDNETN